MCNLIIKISENNYDKLDRLLLDRIVMDDIVLIGDINDVVLLLLEVDVRSTSKVLFKRSL
jgi:hypothetical protein